MEINGHVYLFFEQSGVFKNEFKKLGYDASDWDIQNNFGQTDHVIDLFAEIENAYRGGGSVFNSICYDDLIMAFFPCIYFCEINETYFCGTSYNYRKDMTIKEKADCILYRSKERQKMYELCLKLFTVCDERNLRFVMENPYSDNHYLNRNFPYRHALIDKNRRLRGDYFVKPTQYFFLNCKPTFGQSFTKPKEIRTVRQCKCGTQQGLCSEERSLISPDYARNFICDFILGKEQKGVEQQLTLF